MSIKTIIVGGLLSLLVAGSSEAQTAGGHPAAAARVKLDFPGGTLGQYVGAVRDQVQNANIVVDSGLEAVKVPKAPLGKVSLPQALQWVTTTVDARRHGIILQPTRSAGDSAQVFVFTTAQAVVKTDTTPYQEKFSKDSYIDSIPNKSDWPETVRLAVVNKLKKRHSVSDDAVTYSSRSRLLTVTGTRTDIMDADQTIGALEQGQRIAAVLPQLQKDVGTMRTQVDSLRLQVAEILKRLPRDPLKP